MHINIETQILQPTLYAQTTTADKNCSMRDIFNFIFLQTIDDKYLYQDQMHAAELLRIKGNRYYTIRTCPNPHVLLLCHHCQYFISTMNKHKSYPFFSQIISLCIIDLLDYIEDDQISNISICLCLRYNLKVHIKLLSNFDFITPKYEIACQKDVIRNILSSKTVFAKFQLLFCIHYLTSV